MEGVCFALKRLGVPFRHVFSCDNDKAVRQFIKHHHAPEHYYDDVQTRDNEQAPHVQLYTGGPPCQSFSMAGKRRAMKDPRAACLWSSLDYIVCQKPVAILMEETDNFPVIAEDALNMLLGCLQECGYVYAWTYLNTIDYGVPQSRRRFYLQAVLRSEVKQPLSFPAPLTRRARLVDFMPPPAAGPIQVLPDHAAHAARVQQALNKHAERGVNPFVTPICVDAGASDGWSTSKVDHTMTLTRSHCGSRSYWLTSAGRYLDVEDFARLQGFDPAWLDSEGAQVSATAAGHMLGNAMSINVLEFVLPGLLFSANLISQAMLDDMMRRVKRRWAV